MAPPARTPALLALLGPGLLAGRFDDDPAGIPYSILGPTTANGNGP